MINKNKFKAISTRLNRCLYQLNLPEHQDCFLQALLLLLLSPRLPGLNKFDESKKYQLL